MHILFVDESGTPPKAPSKAQKYFVLGGVIIPEGAWHGLRDKVYGLKIRSGIRGEIKWRHFAPGNTDKKNPMRSMPQDERNAFRTGLYEIITSISSIRLLSVVTNIEGAFGIGWVNSDDDLYEFTYKPVTERFQYYLQDITKATSQKQFGIIICDHRNDLNDRRLRRQHQRLLHARGANQSSYENLVESLILAPSDDSLGIQLADMVAGAVWRKYERGDPSFYDMIESSFRRSKGGEVLGYGVVHNPKSEWR